VDRVQTHSCSRTDVVREGCLLKNFSTGRDLSEAEIGRWGSGDHGLLRCFEQRRERAVGCIESLGDLILRRGNIVNMY